jgi:hypothetical protein
MKKIILFTAIALIFSCKDKQPATGTFGISFDSKGALSLTEALASYNGGKDTTYKISGTIENVCKHTGCWISIKDEAGKEFYINTNETFVIPATVKGHKTTANGKFVKDDNGEVSFSTTGIVVE